MVIELNKVLKSMVVSIIYNAEIFFDLIAHIYGPRGRRAYQNVGRAHPLGNAKQELLNFPFNAVDKFFFHFKFCLSNVAAQILGSV